MIGRPLKTFLNKATTKVWPSFSEDRSQQEAVLEKTAQDTIVQTYIEEDPSVVEWFRGLVPSSEGVTEYVRDLFPCAQWVGRYNVPWLVGDVIAGKPSSM